MSDDRLLELGSREQRSARDRAVARTMFFGFFAMVTVLFVIRTPPWGLMDDAGLLPLAEAMTDSGAIVGAVWQQSVADLRGWGIFRPVYWVWVAVVYSVFSDSPLGAYLATAALNFVGLLIWGAAFARLFDVRGVWRSRVVFALPLHLFVFPPYWNVFTYVSLQEKFVILFAGVAVFAFARGSEERRWVRWALLGWGACLLGLLAKPTMIAVPLAIVVLLLARRALGTVWSSGERAWGLFAALTTASYLVFTLEVQTRGAYTAAYSDALTPLVLVRSAIAAPRSVIALAVVAVLAVLASVRRARNGGQTTFSSEGLFPLGLLAYLVVLLPWGYPTYLLSGTAPFVVGSVLVLARRSGRLLRPIVTPVWVFSPALGMLLLVVFVLDIVPKVGWQADLREAKSFLQDDEIGEAVFYFPPPFVEHAGSLRSFTQRDVRFVATGELDRLELHGTENFLITYLDQGALLLDGVEVGPAVFRNPSWAVHPLVPREGRERSTYQPVFPDARLPLGRRIRQLIG